MNKSAFAKNVGKRLRIRPIAKRFLGEGGPELPPRDNDWEIESASKVGVKIRNTDTDHSTTLGYDHIHEYKSDPGRGEKYGFAILNVQLHIAGCRLWIEPTLRPGEALP